MKFGSKQLTCKRLVLYIAIITILILYPIIMPSRYFVSVLTQILIFSIFISGVNLAAGYAKLASLGHAAFFGTGGYTAVLLSNYVSSNIWLGLTAGIFSSALVAAIFAIISLRVYGTYFLFITLAMGQVVWAITFGWKSLTRGDDGLPMIGTARLFGTISIPDGGGYYYLSLCFLCLTLFVISRITNAPFGHTIVGIRENEPRMRVLGYDVWQHKLVTFIISGAFSGLAGAVWAFYNHFVSPRDTSFSLSAEALLTVILGGSGTLFGPLAGTIIIVIIRNIVSSYTDRWLFVLGMVYILTILFFPMGIINVISGSRAWMNRWVARKGWREETEVPLREGP